MVTAYDYAMAKNVCEAGIEMILVGDSLGNVVLGYNSTVPVTMDEMIHHTKPLCARRRAAAQWLWEICLYELSGKRGGRYVQRCPFLKEPAAQR